MIKLPAIQFYPSDWLGDLGVRSLTFEERGVWIDLLCFMHKSDDRGKLVINGRPMSDQEIAAMIGMEVAKFEQTVQQILSKGVATREGGGALINRRMVSDENLRRVRAECGSEGGKQTATNRIAKPEQKSTPSTSVSVSTSVSTSTKVKTLAPLELEIPEDLNGNEADIKNWLDYKREKGQTYKGDKGLNALWNMIRKIPLGLRKASIEMSMANNYAGIFQVKGDFDGKSKSANLTAPAGKYANI